MNIEKELFDKNAYRKNVKFIILDIPYVKCHENS